MADMIYRRLGTAGVKVSALSIGSWVTYGDQVDIDAAAEQLDVARSYGVNFFDNAESYAGGESETVMGKALAQLDWPRWSYLVSTKLFWGIHDDVNMHNTLNRKYLGQAIDGSLERFGLDFVDLVFCHRADPDTPIEETVWAMSDMVSAGKATYWGTSEWTADEIRAAWDIADRHHLHKPVMEQPQYNMVERRKVEKEFARLYDDIGLGLTTWSPLASGLLTGKYMDGIPAGSRATLQGYEWLREYLTDESHNEDLHVLKEIADDLDASMAQVALAWVVSNPRVSTVITGASKVSQVHDNMAALDVLEAMDDETKARLDDLF